MVHKIKVSAGSRIKLVRLLLGFPQKEFSDLVQMPLIRLKNIELGRSKVREDDFETICPIFPELSNWIAYQGDIHITTLQSSENKLIRMIAAKLELDMIPPGYDIGEFIKQ